MLIEQAIFTSARTDRSDGYQLVSHSPGLSGDDAREIAAWGPSHESLIHGRDKPGSVNFHPLPSGAFCVSWSVAAGEEYSGRGGVQVYTHCLVTPPEVLTRFANNPFALVRAALANGSLRIYEPIPAALESIQLSGRAVVFDRSAVTQVANQPGYQALVALMDAALIGPRVAIVAEARHCESLVTALVNCLPVSYRSDFSFCTGLKPSVRRPFRIFVLDGNPNEQRRLERQGDALVIDVARLKEPARRRLDGWAAFVAAALERRDLAQLSAAVGQPVGHAPEALLEHGNRLLVELNRGADRGAHFTPIPQAVQVAGALDGPAVADNSRTPESNKRADGAHRRRVSPSDKVGAPPNFERAVRHSAYLDAQSPQVLEMLEQLDDAVYAAIHGKSSAMLDLEVLWPIVLEALGPAGIAESREHYLRYALSIWSDYLGDENRDPLRATSALDVLCLLFKEC